MPSLREILEKQKQEKLANVTATKPVLQHQTIQTKTPEQSVEKREAQVEVAEATPGGISRPPTTTGNGVGNSDASVVPSGLTGLALLRWKKENANKSPVNGGREQVATGANEISRTPDRTISTPTLPVDSIKTIGVREAEKTNDGNINLEQLKNNLIYLANNIEQKDLVAQVVRTICIQLKQNPELAPHMKNSDVDLVVRGIRSAYKIAARKRSEKAEIKKTASKGESELMQAFADAGLGNLLG